MMHRMRRRPFPLLALAALLAASVGGGCDGSPTDVGVEPITELPRELTADEVRVLTGSNAFAFGLLRSVHEEEPEPNVFLSPLSVSMALGMAMNGADGETWTQMRDVLGFSGMEEEAINGSYRGLIDLLLGLDPSVEIGLGNSLWSDASRVAFLDGFVERLETSFDAEAATLDFSDPEAKDVINGWVEEVTRGRIQDLIDQIPHDAVAYLVNALYFLGDWTTTFDEDRTRDATFTRADGSTTTVRMMSDEVGYRLLHGGQDGVQGVELPYGGGAFTAVALLPPPGQDVQAFLDGLDPGTWNGWMAQFDAQAETEDDREGFLVELPRFELGWKRDLVDPLQDLGMVAPFSPAAADFSRMNGSRDLVISRVLHQTFVRVDEKGTEAAAATAVEMVETSGPPALTFDRPFLFAIRERYSGAILFLGVIGDPAA